VAKHGASISKHSASKYQTKRLKVNRATFYVDNPKATVKFDNEYADDSITYMGQGFQRYSVPKRDRSIKDNRGYDDVRRKSISYQYKKDARIEEQDT